MCQCGCRVSGDMSTLSPSANAREALLLFSSALVPHPRNWHHVLAFAVGEDTGRCSTTVSSHTVRNRGEMR